MELIIFFSSVSFVYFVDRVDPLHKQHKDWWDWNGNKFDDYMWVCVYSRYTTFAQSCWPRPVRGIYYIFAAFAQRVLFFIIFISCSSKPLQKKNLPYIYLQRESLCILNWIWTIRTANELTAVLSIFIDLLTTVTFIAILIDRRRQGQWRQR